ncbi:MAG: hypothetical protein HQL53_01925 [Magnetococcales bacterium]|nr:hypothetical protein [Magnetococcales bacterium]
MNHMPRIALFANHGSPQLEALRQQVEAQGGEPVVLDINLGGKRTPKLAIGAGELTWEGVDFSDIQAVHIRCTAPNTLPSLPPMLHEISHAEQRLVYLKEQAYSAATGAFFDHLHQLGRLVVNPLTSGYLDHDTKAQLYEKLRASGFPAPRTLTTNDPKQAEAFLRDYPSCVVKPSIGVGSTREVRPDDLIRLEEVRRAPVMFQERATGDVIRVHIVADRVVLSLRVISDGGVDSRTSTRRFEPHTLPEHQESQLVAANRMLGLHYAAWDIIASEDGSYRWLDCNPGPYVMWIGADLVRLLFRELARYLVTFARSGSLEEASASVRSCRHP